MRVAIPAFRRDRLAAARAAAGVTDDDLAAATGASSRQVRNWGSGLSARPRPGVMPRLATALSIDALHLLDVDPDDPPLSALRLRAGLPVRDAAAVAGLPVMSYQRLETGGTPEDPPSMILEALSVAYGVTPHQILASVRRALADRG